MGVGNAGLWGRRILCCHFFSHCFFHVMLNRRSPVLALLLSCKTMLLERERERALDYCVGILPLNQSEQPGLSLREHSVGLQKEDKNLTKWTKQKRVYL